MHGCATTIDTDVRDRFSGKSLDRLRNVSLKRMLRIEVAVQRPPSGKTRCQHRGMFARAILLQRSLGNTVSDCGNSGILAEWPIGRVAQVILRQVHQVQNGPDSHNVIALPRVRRAGQN